MPTITGITYISPKTNKFKLGVDNTFYIDGTGLAGASLDTLAGCSPPENLKKKVVAWSSYGVVDATDPARLKVHGTPAKTSGDCTQEDDVKETDPGSVTPTVSNGGQTVQQTVPADYGP